MIKVILQEDIKGQGSKDDIVEVSDGFARNFLFPHKKAVAATPEAIEKNKAQKEKREQEASAENQKRLQTKEKIEKTKISLSKKSQNENLFGSVSSKEIIDALNKKGVKLSSKQIAIKNPLKTIGSHKIEIDLGNNIKAKLTLEIKPE